ncbi:low molecular weight protein-tyrosine-phosphatase [Thiohalorhabdus methylotrophus]|uniref:protein-tyrosine-phosphatase n=1 Tax=Thiohalorhabdus methylotrophus TaxID=3242694 RepID=A0ABV4TXI0_9GAMM
MRILVVCLGNICRSPTAHAVLERKLAEAGFAGRVQVDSAGTGDYHIGGVPDPRACEAAAERGYDLTHLRARQVEPADFVRFDMILAADSENFADLVALAPGAAERAKVKYLLDYAGSPEQEIPDPYEEEAQAFGRVLDLVEEAADGLVEALQSGDWTTHASA